MLFTQVTKIKTFLYVSGLVIIALFVINMAGDYSVYQKATTSARTKVKNRMNKMMENWPEIIKNPNETTLFVGTSVFHYFLNPKTFDAEMSKNNIKSKSFNIAFQGVIGVGLYTYVERLKRESEKTGTHFENIVFEIIPSAESKKFYRNHQNFIEIGYPDIFLDTPSWISLGFKDPITTVYLYLINNVRPIDWGNIVESVFQQKKYRKRIERFAGITNIWSLPAFYEVPEWNPDMSGMVNWNRPQSNEVFEKTIANIHQSETWNKFISDYIKGNSVSADFEYEESLINYYIEAINLSKSFAKNIYVLKLPLAPSFQQEVDKFVDEDYMLNRVKKETGATIYDFTRSEEVKDTDFADPMHLLHNTMDRYLVLLASEIAKNKSAQ